MFHDLKKKDLFGRIIFFVIHSKHDYLLLSSFVNQLAVFIQLGSTWILAGLRGGIHKTSYDILLGVELIWLLGI